MFINLALNEIPSHLFHLQPELLTGSKKCHLMFLGLKARHLVKVLGGKLHRNNVL